MEYLEWKADGSLPKLYYIFHLKRKLSFKQHYLQWQWFSSWKTSWIHFNLIDPLHHSTPETGGWGASWQREQSVSPMKRDQEALQSQFIRHHDVLFLEPKSFGFLTTIFSLWFLAGTKKIFLPQKLFWKSSTSHSSFASWPSLQKHGTRQQLLAGIYFP